MQHYEFKEQYKALRNNYDRRINNRINTRFDTIIFVNDGKFDSTIQNLSGNGMQIAEPLQNNIQLSQCLHILIKDGNKRPIELDAYVMWKQHGLIGLSFVDLSRTMKSRLNTLLNHLLLKSVAESGMIALA